ncbi:uncharacterized protein EDB91DRAFT_1118835 [Suillus paluster]|uniref:uncharacterized protein n=1 Tax=Suillus paluster TaxID=48578 RepID=UPI001B866C86|nr:uncharacterized protein EDB91DRAFT_1118835 [Suillus paluster]KAG1746775.1 hypothetical protein EDB91DRAFT_1118835 [Suillus paluster]
MGCLMIYLFAAFETRSCSARERTGSDEGRWHLNSIVLDQSYLLQRDPRIGCTNTIHERRTCHRLYVEISTCDRRSLQDDAGELLHGHTL